jgi:hypothetical protein
MDHARWADETYILWPESQSLHRCLDKILGQGLYGNPVVYKGAALPVLFSLAGTTSNPVEVMRLGSKYPRQNSRFAKRIISALFNTRVYQLEIINPVSTANQHATAAPAPASSSECQSEGWRLRICSQITNLREASCSRIVPFEPGGRGISGSVRLCSSKIDRGPRVCAPGELRLVSNRWKSMPDQSEGGGLQTHFWGH